MKPAGEESTRAQPEATSDPDEPRPATPANGEEPDDPNRASRLSRAAHLVLTLLIYGAIALIPVTFSVAGDDSFRLPQMLLLRAFGIMTGVALVMVALTDESHETLRFLAPRKEVRLALAVVLWYALALLWSTNRALSIETLSTVIPAAILFIGAVAAARFATTRIFFAFAFSSIVNAVIMVLQEARIWHPFGNEEFGHAANGALLGNPNDVGTFLCVPALLMIILTLLSSGWRRVACAIGALILVAGLLASITITALAALVAGSIAFALLRVRRRTAVLFLAAGIVAAAVAVRTVPTLAARLTQIRTAVRDGQLNRVTGGRVSASAAALEMLRAHPIGGVGPGTFEFNYIEYRLGAEERYPRATAWPEDMGARVMFRQTHNDHLQIAAEAGIVGYALFAAALAMVAMTRRRRHAGAAEDALDFRARFAHAAAIPVVVTIAVLAIAQFPLQIAAPSVTLLVLAAVIRAWGEDEWAAS